jgi:hypothetical protein
MRRKIGDSKQPPPSREEWDFRARGNTGWYDDRKYDPFDFLDDNEIYFCLCYEADRNGPNAQLIIEDRDNPVRRVEELPQPGTLPKFKEERLSPCPEWIEWKQRCKDWPKLSFDERAVLRKRTFDALLDQYLRLSPDHSVFAEWFYIPWPEWPDMPYLSIPRDERKRRREKSWGKNPKPTLKLVRLADIYKDVEAWKQGKTPNRVRSWHPLHALEMNEDIWVLRQLLGQEENQAPIEIAAFEIDHSLSPKRQTLLFNNWLVQRRKMMGYKHRENRGPTSRTGRLRAQLVALGARRLLDSGMTYKKAADYTKALTGRPLYAHESEWSGALRSEITF